MIPWFGMSTSRNPYPNEDVSTHVLGLETTRGMFKALSTTESKDHSHSALREARVYMRWCDKRMLLVALSIGNVVLTVMGR